MTAYLALRDLRPRDEVTAPPYEAGPLESLMGLEAGDEVSVRELLYGLLLASGNDAAAALAIRVSGSIADFVDRMNAAAARLGLADTTYVDPIGLGSGNVSSARDLVALATRLRRDRLFRRIVDTPRVTLSWDGERRRLVNRNTLVRSTPFVDGVKTGTTVAAGHVLVASGKRRGVQFVAALLGAPGEAARDSATLTLLRYGASLYRERTLVGRGERIATVALGDDRGSLELVADGALRAVARADQQVATEFRRPAPPEGAVARGQPFGVATVKLDGREVGEVEVVAARAVAAPESGLPSWTLFVGGLAAFVAIGAILVARRSSR